MIDRILMMKNLYGLLILLLLVLGLFGWAPSAQAQTATVVRLDPVYTTVAPNEAFSVDVMVENVENFWAFDVIITYDPDYLVVVSVDWGDFLEVGLTIPGIKIDEPDPGTVRCGMTQQTPAEPQSGSGVLCTINFKAKELEGETNIEITFTELVDGETYLLIPNDPQGSSVQIGSGKTEYMNYLPLVIQ